MSKRQQTENNRPKHPEKEFREGMMLPAKVYIVRVIFTLMTLALLAVNDSVCRNQPGTHMVLLLCGLAYPHLGHLAFGRFDINRRRGHILFAVDGLFMGAVIAAIEFAMFPSMVLSVIMLFNWMIVGGPALIALGLTLMFAGALTMGIDFPTLPITSGSACTVSNWLGSAILVAYFLIVARIIHQLVGALRLQQVGFQARSDSADTARIHAERALLAVLPPSAARQLATRERLEPELLHGVPVLLLEFGRQDQTPSLDEMQDALHVCDTILTRHGIELVKSFGHRAIAIGRGTSGPDEAVKAVLELAAFFSDHRGKSPASRSSASIRALIAQGSVTIGLVQPERLNLDLFGDAVDELASLASHQRQTFGVELIVSSAVFGKLHDNADFVPLGGDDAAPPCHIHQPATMS